MSTSGLCTHVHTIASVPHACLYTHKHIHILACAPHHTHHNSFHGFSIALELCSNEESRVSHLMEPLRRSSGIRIQTRALVTFTCKLSSLSQSRLDSVWPLWISVQRTNVQVNWSKKMNKGSKYPQRIILTSFLVPDNHGLMRTETGLI